MPALFSFIFRASLGLGGSALLGQIASAFGWRYGATVAETSAFALTTLWAATMLYVVGRLTMAAFRSGRS